MGSLGMAVGPLHCRDAQSNTASCQEDSNTNIIGGSFAKGAWGRGLGSIDSSSLLLTAPRGAFSPFLLRLYCKIGNRTECKSWWYLGDRHEVRAGRRTRGVGPCLILKRN